MPKMTNIKALFRISKVVGKLKIVMLLAVITGVFGFLTAIGITFLGGIGLGTSPLLQVISPNSKALSTTIINLIFSFTILFGVIRGALRYVEQYANHYIAFKLLATIRLKVYDKLDELAPQKLEGKKRGDIISMVTADIETLEVFYAHTISPFLISLSSSIIIFVVTGLLSSWWFSLLYLVCVIVIGFVIPFSFGPMLNKLGKSYRQKFADFNAYFFESLKGLREIISYNYSDSQIKSINEKSYELTTDASKLNIGNHWLFGVTTFFVSILITCSLGLSLILNSTLTPAQLIIGVISVFSGLGPVIALSNLPSTLNQTFASARRIATLLDEKPNISSITNGEDFSFKNLTVNNLSFGYSDTHKILDNVSLSVEKGEIVSLIGSSGSGKSTLLKLLLRYYEVNDNSIKYNNISINQINTKSLYDNISLVNQNIYLFNDTILENIRMGYPEKTLEDVIIASKKASIHDFITSLPNGYETTIKAINENISAGEKQRIGLARAFLKNAPLILLDEPTSNVDAFNEKVILSSLLREKENYAIIIISHRSSTFKIADRIYKIANGQINEEK